MSESTDSPAGEAMSRRLREAAAQRDVWLREVLSPLFEEFCAEQGIDPRGATWGWMDPAAS